MNSISRAASLRLGKLDLYIRWDFRLKTKSGSVYTLPPRAIKSRSRSGSLDGSTWTVKLELDRRLLPKNVDPKQYETIEIDMLVDGNAAPVEYFRGVIEEPESGQSYEGSVAEPLTLNCFGVLQRLAGYWVSRWRPTLDYLTQSMGTMQIVCTTQRQIMPTAIAAGSSERLPKGAVTFGADSSSYFKIYTSTAMTATYTHGTDYTVDLTKVPLQITWVNPGAAGRVIQWAQIDRIVKPVPSTALEVAVLPFSRSPLDMFPTTVAAVNNTSKTIKVSDTTGWTTLLDTILNYEHVAVIKTDGTTFHYKITSVASDGTLQLDTGAGYDLSTVTVGLQCRLSTSEHYQSFYALSSGPLFATTWGGSTYWNHKYFAPVFDQGIILPTAINISSSVGIFSNIPYIDQESDNNRIEEIIKAFLVDTGLYNAADVVTEQTGVFAKDFAFNSMFADEVVSTLGQNAVTPNTRIHDEPDGTVSIKPYSQKTTPDWTMKGVWDIKETDAAELPTAVTVVSEGDHSNVAPQTFLSASNFSNYERIVDNSDELEAGATTSTSTASVTFRLPEETPLTCHPYIDKIVVTGKGLLTVTVTYDGITKVLPTWTRRALGDTGVGTIEISSGELYRVLPNSTNSKYVDIKFAFDPLRTGDTLPGAVSLTAACSEIRILTKQAGAWRAAFTDVSESYALSFDGTTNAYVQAANDTYFYSTFTVEAWIYATALGTYARILDFGMGANNSDVALGVYDTTGKLFISLYNAGAHIGTATATDAIPLNRWVHVAATLSGTSLVLYQDGTQVGNATLSASFNARTRTSCLFGKSNWATNGYLTGYLRDVRVWLRAKAASEVQADMLRRMVPSTEDNLVAWWPMTEGASSPLDQVLGNGTTQGSGATWVASSHGYGLAAADSGTSAVGNSWLQPDTSRRESYRYMPTDDYRRLALLHPNQTFSSMFPFTTGQPPKDRDKIIRLKGISPMMCRDYAERWLDELYREGKSYTVQGLLDPRARLGDTVRVIKRDGTYLDLFLWGMTDGGGPGDLECTYTFKDFGR